MRRTGHIRERSPGAFELRYSLGTDPATGKRRIATATVRGARKDAEKELRRLLRAVDTGEHVAAPNQIRVGEWLTQWLNIVRPEVSAMTYDLYAGVVERHLAPALGRVQIAKLGAMQIQQLFSGLADGGGLDGKAGPLAPSTRRLIYRILHAALARAAELQIISRNPSQALRKRLPKAEKREAATLSLDQIEGLLREVKDTPLYSAVLLAVATGMRRGEVLALRWRNVDLDRGEVKVAESVEYTKSGLRAKSPKNQGIRIVTLPSFATDELRRLKREQAESHLAIGVRQTGDSLVCARPDTAQIHPVMLTRRFRQVTARLGFPSHFHALRHSHASFLLAAGVHPKVAQERLGHSTVALTLDVYSHLTQRLRDDAAAKVDAMLFSRSKEPVR